MELRHLQALAAVAEQGSFSAAAEMLGTVQSNVSAHVARLERELKTTLVDRSASRLNPEGEIVLARANRVIDEVSALGADLAALNAEVTGTVRAGMIGTTARWLVPVLLDEIGARFPRLRIVVAEGTSLALQPRVALGRLDAAVLTLPVPGRDLVTEPLFDEDLVLVVPVEGDPLPGRSEVSLAELSSFRLLLPAPGTPFRAEIDAAIKPAGIKLEPRAEFDGVRLIASLTFEGYGPAVLPATAVPPHLRSRFRPVAIRGLPPRRVHLALRARGLPAAPTRAFLATLRELVRSGDLPEGLHRAPGHANGSEGAEGAPRVVGMPMG